ncbi:MAG TPA: alpha-galactosidase [Bacteroidota bacterium]|nr:alpha-galactosidase [Bacteroidota bacterium]
MMQWDRFSLRLCLLTLSVCLAVSAGFGAGKQRSFVMANGKITCTITVDSLQLLSERLEGQEGWLKGYVSKDVAVSTDADFSLEVMWTDWQAPGKVNNADNPIVLTKKDFHTVRYSREELKNGKQRLLLEFAGNDFSLGVRVIYELGSEASYLRRSLEVFDTAAAGHYLQQIRPLDAAAAVRGTVVKEGGFGQPVAIAGERGGCFFGLEYPTSVNSVQSGKDGIRIACGTEVGRKIGSSPFRSEPVVEGLCPEPAVKKWFMQYVNDIRVAPLRPYTLYNSWYDLRSPEYPRVAPENVMNVKNIQRIISLLRRNMIDRHHIPLDAFVLDDGWDVYQSDWKLRTAEFPDGLKPIADTLKQTHTSLGLWFGPSGGYSFRMKRINWMADHGYEVTGHTPNTAMLCLGGEHYSDLFRNRTTSFVANDGVGYFKWDGIQFSCSEPDHGHPVGIYSRRAVMESVIDKCNAVRAINPNVFLNISSGTWLSPWWVKYANQIWMQGEDYGYADVPSISPRDAAITYRDFSLYEDFRTNDFWFPIQNLMTHGIIKGNLEKLGGEAEPLDKFTNEVLLYFARGVSMWELYISPDILTEAEWDAMGNAMVWARDRFPVLAGTEMIGGDPKKRETYGYVHFSGNRAIIAARNPWVTPGTLRAELSPASGLSPDASSLVLERVYPTRWISPKLFRSGTVLELPLDAYETAVYELYPLADAKRPLVAGVRFETDRTDPHSYGMTIYRGDDAPVVLNKDSFPSFRSGNADFSSGNIEKAINGLAPRVVPKAAAIVSAGTGGSTMLSLPSDARRAELQLLLTPDETVSGKPLPSVVVRIDDRTDTAGFLRGDAASTWYTMAIPPGDHAIAWNVVARDTSAVWRGHIGIWLEADIHEQGAAIEFTSGGGISEPPMPPPSMERGVRRENIRLGEQLLPAGSR